MKCRWASTGKEALKGGCGRLEAAAAARAGQGSGSGWLWVWHFAVRMGTYLAQLGTKGAAVVYWRAAEADFLARVRLR